MPGEARKNCPMAYVAVSREVDISYFDLCREGECAWWNKESEACAVLAISNFIAVSWLTVDAVFGEKRDKKSKKGRG